MAKLEIRLTDAELERLRAEASGELSSYVRGKLGLGPARRGRPPKTSQAELRGLENIAESMRHEAAQRIAAREVPRYGCPTHGCEFRSKSLAAKCPHHGRSVVPV